MSAPGLSAGEFAALRRFPDVEADNLYAVDAADRLLIDEAADALAVTPPASVVVIGDGYGALTLGAISLGAQGVRVHQDALSGERALANNAEALGRSGFDSLPLDAASLAGARIVLLRLPRSLDALDEIAATIAAVADPEVVVFAGGRVKHMTTTMNDVLGRYFDELDVTHARQKARVLIARAPKPAGPARWPRRSHDEALGIDVVSFGAAFAGASVDVGTRFLLEYIDAAVPDAARAIDLGCGTGVIATTLGLRRRGLHIIATDQSASAIASALETVRANGVAERVSIVRDDALSDQPDASTELIVLNPPFHIGSTVHTGIARKLVADAARVLQPGGELWTVWNSHLRYRPMLEALVGPTRQIARNATFTVTASRRP